MPTNPAPSAFPSVIIPAGAARLALPFGLLSHLTVRPNPESTPRWITAGGQWLRSECAPLEALAGSGGPVTSWEGGGGVLEAATPFTVRATSQGSMDLTPEQARAWARERLLTREGAAVESVLWNGLAGVSPTLSLFGTGAGGATSPRPTLNTDPLGIVAAISLLEGFLADVYGSVGVLHMGREAAMVGLAQQALTVKGSGASGQLTTALGTPVIAGAGYSPLYGDWWENPEETRVYPDPPEPPRPYGEADDWQSTAPHCLIHATPPLFAYRSDIAPKTSDQDPANGAAGNSDNGSDGDSDDGYSFFDRATNTMHAIAERTYLIGWDSGAIGSVQVNLDMQLGQLVGASAGAAI